MQGLTVLINTIAESNKNVADALIQTSANTNPITPEVLMKGLTTVADSINQANKNMMDQFVAILPSIISNAVKAELLQHKKEEEDKDVEDEIASEDQNNSQKGKPPTDYKSAFGGWNFIAPSTLQWLSLDVTAPLHKLVIRIQNGVESDLGLWNLLMNSFLSAVVSPRKDRGFHCVISSFKHSSAYS
jgi:hypothetical protein